MIDTINSVIGNAHQTPVIAPIHDNKNAVGIITKILLIKKSYGQEVDVQLM